MHVALISRDDSLNRLCREALAKLPGGSRIFAESANKDVTFVANRGGIYLVAEEA
jgi:hypothetical protein